MLDLTASPVTRASCYQPWVDPKLPHQLRINWASVGRSQCMTTVGVCNCGWQSEKIRPESPDALNRMSQQYAMHVTSLL